MSFPLHEVVKTLEPLQELERRVRALAAGAQEDAVGLAGSLSALVLAHLFESSGQSLLAVAPDRASAEALRDDLLSCLGTDSVLVFGLDHVHGGDEHAGSASDIPTLRLMAEAIPAVIVTHAEALLRPLPPPESVLECFSTLRTGSVEDPSALVARLRAMGYESKDFVETRGDVARRGGIVDVFSFGAEVPLRLEFAEETIESIREFDPLSQRSIRPLSVAHVSGNLLSDRENNTGGTSLLAHAPEGTLLVLEEAELTEQRLRDHTRHTEELDPADVLALSGQSRRLRLHLLGSSAHAGAVDFGAREQPAFNASIAQVRSTVSGLLRQGYRVLFVCDTSTEQHRLRELLAASYSGESEEEVPDCSGVEVSVGAVHRGFLLPAISLALFTEHQVFNRLKRRGARKRPTARGLSQRELLQLRRGDYVVHQDYGIGRFDRLQRIRVRAVEQEVVKLLYEENDVLYVNLNYITRLQKYSSREGHLPKLTRLGSPDWDRLRARAKRRVKDIARELIQLYARRKRMVGQAFPEDQPWQRELEASFIYEDTFDQARATREVKQDMELPHPMDRLICGDVGFGKTEVAVRAAFKAVLGGAQVAVLVPTTILAMQHYATFSDRTSRYGVRVRVLSRFNRPAEQRAILEEVRQGSVDIVIGTHRLLSRDVTFRNLGLLVVDEEHRFGVAAKEKLRQIRASVDTLTLTATPIPRTLHFSLMGARDLSIIATAPRNRLPIITEILQWDDAVLREAVLREVQRGGQVYVVHDRVQTIPEVLARLQALVPEVRMRHAHGQMPGRELEGVMLEFLEKKVDVIVATKIIESGLDIPNVNTIIVNRADRFGMAELYQLRGRVGRSNIQAYAYLIAPPLSILPRPTLQRLRAMQEFTELGSGFHLAMRDLEIRGAGNLLGAEQSGFIDTMGFETYTRILEDAVQELREEEFQDLFPGGPGRAHRPDETTIEVDVAAFIPDTYVKNDVERFALYRRLYGAASPAQIQEIREELTDRFGAPPPEVQHLFGAVTLRMLAGRMGFPRLTIIEGVLELDFPPQSRAGFYDGEGFQRVMAFLQASRGLSLIQTGETLRLRAPMPAGASPLGLLEASLELLEKIEQQL
jgi:transcription-repair coupling factor (superfamily II helicase)